MENYEGKISPVKIVAVSFVKTQWPLWRHGICRKRWLVQLFCHLQFSRGQIERGKFKQDALEVDNQPSILRTDGFRVSCSSLAECRGGYKKLWNWAYWVENENTKNVKFGGYVLDLF